MCTGSDAGPSSRSPSRARAAGGGFDPFGSKAGCRLIQDGLKGFGEKLKNKKIGIHRAVGPEANHSLRQREAFR
jgi:hypothetical protein